MEAGEIQMLYGVQVCKEYLHWSLKFVNVTRIGLFGSRELTLNPTP